MRHPERDSGPILIMAGGTGGHVFPALAVAAELRTQGVSLAWLGTRGGLEARVVPEAGIPLAFLSISGLRGKNWLTWLVAPARLALALIQALRVVHRLRPRAVLGMGGFVTGPGGVACWLSRRPLLIHEQNALPGLTNRYLARLARQVMEGFPGTFPSALGAVATGNPVRAAIAALPVPEQRLARHPGRLRLLILGGSQGARALNQLIPEALHRLSVINRPEVWHQSGPRHLEAASATYQQYGIAARLVPFIEQMEVGYAWADLVICRAGALTVAELAAAGVASILVPFPYAVDDHQTQNARFLADRDAALLIQERDLTPARLSELLQELDRDRSRLSAMAIAARALARPEATARVAGLCLEIANG